MRQRKYDIICLQETHVTKTVSDVWMKEWGGVIFFDTYSTQKQVCTQEITVQGNTVPAVLFPTATVCKVQWKRAMGFLIWELSFLTPGLATRSWQC